VVSSKFLDNGKKHDAEHMTDTRKALWLIASAVLILGLLGPVLVDDVPGHTLFWQTMFEFGHVPLFGAISLVLLGLVRTLKRGSERNPWLDYLFALVGAMLLTLVSELVQYFGPRDASLSDLLRDLAGACCALAFMASVDSRLIQTGLLAQSGRKWTLRIVSIGLVMLFLLPFPAMINAYHQRRASFPSIGSFESTWESKFMGWVGSWFLITAPPPEWHEARGIKAVRVTFAYTKYPRMVVEGPFPDWRGYQFLVFDLYSEMEQTVPLVVRVDDLDHNEEYDDRFNRRLDIEPGAHSVRISLDDIRRAPHDREMQMDAIRWVVLFMIDPAEPVTLWVDNIRLE
jgi:hypothetical protein